ncbi:MAG TPA: nucleotidyltransferase domain-containing protein [bacterium]|nr:nucleotidyltransferase domain-containing protein [bacterium]
MLNKKLLNSIIEQITSVSDTKEIIIFGSRARGDNRYNSDIDIALVFDGDIARIRDVVEENVRTLLKFDILDYNKIPKYLKNEINKEGVIVYEKT